MTGHAAAKKVIGSVVQRGKRGSLNHWAWLECGHWRQAKRVKTPLRRRRFTCPSCRRTEEYWRKRKAEAAATCGGVMVDHALNPGTGRRPL